MLEKVQFNIRLKTVSSSPGEIATSFREVVATKAYLKFNVNEKKRLYV